MKRNGAFAIALLAMSGIAGGASAAPSAPKCLESKDFFVIARENPLGPGSDIIARRKKEGGTYACTFQQQPGDFEVGRRDDADYVLGLSGRFLVMDRGTGPNRILVVYDLSLRKDAVSVAYDTSVPVKVEPEAVFFSAVTGRATARNCPQFRDITRQGLVPSLAADSKLTFPSLARARVGAPRCIAQQ